MPGGGITPANIVRVVRETSGNEIHASLLTPVLLEICVGSLVGVLNRKSQVDVARTRELVELAHPLRVTFHRAFDQSQSWQDSLEAVIQTDIENAKQSGMDGVVGIHKRSRAASMKPALGVTPPEARSLQSSMLWALAR